MKMKVIEVFTILCLFALANCEFSKENEKIDNFQNYETKSLNAVKKNCRFCKWLIDTYKSGINNSLTVKEVQNLAIDTCEIFNEEKKDSCISFFLGVGKDIIDGIIKNENTIKICHKLNFCYLTNYEIIHMLKINIKHATPPNFYDCKMCQKYIGYIEDSMKKSLSPNFVLEKLKKACNVFKHFQKQNCIVYYDQIGIKIIKLLLINEKPENICKYLSYCKNKIEPKAFKSNSLSTDLSNHCQTCKDLVGFYEYIINDNLPISEIQKDVFKFCDIYNENLRQQCIAFYQGIGLEIIKAIVQKEDPIKVCQILHLCLKKTEVNQYITFTDIMSDLRLSSNLDNCTPCTNVITWFEMNMNLSRTPEEDQDILLGFCGIFKCPYNDECIRYYTGIGYEIVKSILKKTDPESICKQFHFCKSRNIKSIPMKVSNTNLLSTDPSNDCKTCKFLVAYYEGIINDNLPIREIQDDVIKVCDIYNENLRQQCIAFYQGMGLEIIKAIVQKENPIKVCQILQLCLKNTEVNQYMTFTDIMTGLISPSNINNCTTCTNVITWFEMNMNLSKTPEEDQDILLRFCGILKSPYHDECKRYYTGIGYEIVKSILNKTDPERICIQFHFCQSRNIKSIPLKVILN